MARNKLPAGLILGPKNLFEFIYRPRRYSAMLRRRYGDMVTMRAPHTSLVMCLTAEGARQVLTGDPGDYKPFQTEAFRGLAGDGSLFVLEGDQHHRERKLLMPAFDRHHVRNYGLAIQEIVRRHMAAWQPGQLLKAQDAMLDISRDTILRVVYGDDHEKLRQKGLGVLARMLCAAHPLLEYVPQFQNWPFPPWIRFQRVKKEFSAFVTETMQQRRQSKADSQDVLNTLLTAHYEDGKTLSDDEIRDELYTILLPGHATTGVAIAWALYELGRHPVVLQQLREELVSLGPDPDPEMVARLPYLDAVCRESMRLHTIVTETARMTVKPCRLFDYEIPPGVGLGVSMSAIHQDPELYPEPEQFRPERFIERSYGPFEFLPFGGGHRRCMGAALSDYEMRLTVAMIVSHWKYENAAEEQEVRHNLGVGAKNGVSLTMKALVG